VDLIVDMRANRDGLVELPKQLRFIAKMLRLPDTAIINNTKNTNTITVNNIFLILIVVMIIIITIIYFKK
jgi:hypothetical protein